MMSYTWHPPQAASAPAPASAPPQPPAAAPTPNGQGPVLHTYIPANPNPPAQQQPPAPPQASAPIQPVAAVPVAAIPMPIYMFHPNAYFYGYGIPRVNNPTPPGNGNGNGGAGNPYVWRGLTKSQVDAQNLHQAHNTGATQPRQLVPANAQPGQMFYVRELDGSYTLRNHYTIQNAMQPGYWVYSQAGGYPYFVRQAAS